MSECATFAKGERHGVTQAMSTTEWRAKVRLSILLRLFVDYSFVWSLIFCIFENQGHFRTARYGVYIGLCCMFDYGIRGCRNEINS